MATSFTPGRRDRKRCRHPGRGARDDDGRPADFELSIRIIQDQQIRLLGCATYVSQDYATAIKMIESELVRAEDFITGRFPLERAGQAFEGSTSGEHIEVFIHP